MRPKNTSQIPFGRKRSGNRFLWAKPLIRSEMIGSALQSADLENFSVFEMAER